MLIKVTNDFIIAMSGDLSVFILQNSFNMLDTVY